MYVISNILVGIDLNRGESPAAPLDAVAQGTLAQALWMAGASQARLTIFSALASRGPTAEDAARAALHDLVGRATAMGVRAEAVMVPGHGWMELVRQVVRGGHDLLLVGTHDPHGLRRLLLGSTARKLLNECPCPVWVSKGCPAVAPRNILVASDLSPLSDTAVRLGLALGRMARAHTHLLDVVEYPLDRLWVNDPADRLTTTYHHQLRGAAEHGLRAQVERSGSAVAEPEVAVHVADGDGIPDHAIIKFIADHHIDLLVLGTEARHGLSGTLLGNTAERLLPEVPCSVLAVKPPDFKCRVPVE